MTTEDRERGIAMIGEMMDVSRETMDRLDNYVALLEKWQRAKNLVGSDTLARAWTRHVADSAQALAAVPDAKRWLDLGSGAGFPGVVTAILLAGVPGAGVDLIECECPEMRLPAGRDPRDGSARARPLRAHRRCAGRLARPCAGDLRAGPRAAARPGRNDGGADRKRCSGRFPQGTRC